MPPAAQEQFLTIMFTDLVGSTQMKTEWGTPKFLADIWEPHEAILKRVIEGVGGAKFRGSRGDGYRVTFTSPKAAVEVALKFQYELRSHEFANGVRPQVRIGIHCGTVQILANGDIAGLGADICGRITDSCCQSGQTLLTKSAHDQAVEYLKNSELSLNEAESRSISWQTHGEWKFKGIDSEWELFEVSLDGMERLPPPTESSKAWLFVDAGDWRPVAGEPFEKRPGWTLEKKLGQKADSVKSGLLGTKR
ncbi:MAG: adenylate/guanylate cyclase domain-containing protein [Planctomycetales bacterium]|nr:adenylate/guanylate cyclase domain-containing protein [Planctomycetales bacterium]